MIPKSKSQEGQGLVEYALLIVLIALLIALLAIFGRQVYDTFQMIIDVLPF